MALKTALHIPSSILPCFFVSFIVIPNQYTIERLYLHWCHIASDPSFKERGLPTQALEVHVHRAKGFKITWGNHHITFNIGSTVYRSSIKMTKSRRESVMIKLSDKKKEPLGIITKSWQSGQAIASSV